MSPKTFPAVATVVAATLVNFVVVAPAHAQAKPALVRDVDRSTLQPVNGYCYSYTSGNFGPLKCTLYSVPAGKRLVVETVSYSGRFHPGKAPNQIVFGLNNPNLGVVIFPAGAAPGTPIYSNTYSVIPMLAYEGDYRYFGLAQTLRMYIDESQSFAASAFEDGSNNEQPQYFAFSGYLVDK